jgi:hypothetical protein
LKLNIPNKLLQRMNTLPLPKKHRYIISIFLLMLILALLPFGVEQIQLKNTPVKNILSLEYVEYEGELFNSIVLTRRYSEDAALLSDFETTLQHSLVRPYGKQKDIRQILIIRTEEKTFYTYVQGDLLGLNYGQVKLYLPHLPDLLQSLPATEITTKQKQL